MKAADCLREPGDAARRESDRAILVGWGGGMGCFAFPRSETVRWKLADIPGDDWQPLHPAGEGDWMARAYGAESVVKCEQQKNAELAAEVKRLTAELATATQTAGQELEWRVQAQLFGDKLQAEVNTLTARVAELESGSAFVGEEIKPGDFCADGELIYYLPKVDAPQDTLLAKECEGSAVVSDDGRIRYRCTFPTTAPLPTAGDEGAAEKISAGIAEQTMREYRAGNYLTTEEFVAELRSKGKPIDTGDPAATTTAAEFMAAHPAPAEPDSPAEERRKPSCLDGVPAVLCEYQHESWQRSFGIQYWVYGPIFDGKVAGVRGDSYLGEGLQGVYVSELTPIHHDPTDAAAEALRSEIEGGGSNG